MRFQEELKCKSREQIWNEYCGYLDLSLPTYVCAAPPAGGTAQTVERKPPWANDAARAKPKKSEELRHMLPLTSYRDYALFAAKAK
ncbi:MAG: hypothetical protein ACLUUJ_03580 [Acutalibacteraceae bacterium]